MAARPQSAASLPRLGTPDRFHRVPTPEQVDNFYAARRPGRFAHPTAAKQIIYGESGPAMDGVIHYPYTTSQRLYRDDFETMVMASLTHPYSKTTVSGASSLPHNILSGSNFDDGRLGGIQKNWVSEAERAWVPRSLTAMKQVGATGVRSECVQFLG